MLDGDIKLFLIKAVKRNTAWFCAAVFFVYSLFFAPQAFAGSGKDTSVAKENIAVNVSTTDHSNWYDDRCSNGKDDDGDGKIDTSDPDCDGGNKDLHPNMVCDYDNKQSSGYINPLISDLSYSPCDKDGAHDDYYSTSTSNEAYVQPSDKNFTISANASDPSGIDSIRIEWIAGASVGKDLGTYWDPAKLAEYQKTEPLNPHKSAFTCMGKTHCEICVAGGSCANPVIPTGDLGIAGYKYIILFRVTVTDGAMNTATTGFDDSKTSPILDRFYRFVICSNSSDCNANVCANSKPVASFVGYSWNFSCGQSSPLYTLKWKFKDKDAGSYPSSYVLEVRDRKNGNAIYSAVRTAPLGLSCSSEGGYAVVCEMSAVLFSGFLQKSDGSPANIEWGNGIYDWRVKVYDNSKEFYCLGVSDWTSWSNVLDGTYTPPDPVLGASFQAPYAPPVPSFTITNSATPSVNCVAGGCETLQNIVFQSTSAIDPNSGTPTYKWYIDVPTVYSTNSSTSDNFPKGAASHQVALSVTDGLGRTCSVQQTFSLSDAASTPSVPPVPPTPPTPPASPSKNPGWNEIAPNS